MQFAVTEQQTSSPEDLLRAQPYRLLSRFLARSPDSELLARAAEFEGDDSDLGHCLHTLGRIARHITAAGASREYHDLFIGLGRGDLVPFASYYLTGFLNEKPLAALRGDMQRLGIARADDVKEPEDHIGALCDMMAGLIEGDFGAPVDLTGQRAFFTTHIEPWAGRFFHDLEAAKGASLYTPIGTFGHQFMTIESTAFAMED